MKVAIIDEISEFAKSGSTLLAGCVARKISCPQGQGPACNPAAGNRGGALGTARNRAADNWATGPGLGGYVVKQ
jgi:hypothetical protein